MLLSDALYRSVALYLIIILAVLNEHVTSVRDGESPWHSFVITNNAVVVPSVALSVVFWQAGTAWVFDQQVGF